MMGFWLLANFFANLIGGFTGSYIDKISSNIGLTGFFFNFYNDSNISWTDNFLFKNNLIRRMHGHY